MRCKYCDSVNVVHTGDYEKDGVSVLQGWVCYDCSNDFCMPIPDEDAEQSRLAVAGMV